MNTVPIESATVVAPSGDLLAALGLFSLLLLQPALAFGLRAAAPALAALHAVKGLLVLALSASIAMRPRRASAKR